jgi:hypothetical protein
VPAAPRAVCGVVLAFYMLLAFAACDVSVPARLTSANDGEVSTFISNQRPWQQSPVTVSARLVINGQPIAGARMTATWRYRTTTPSCSSYTSGSGLASCTRYIGGATPGHRVKISISIDWNGKTYHGEASFTPL